MHAQLTPFRIQCFLRGLRYPASKPRIIAYARERGAGLEVIDALMTLEECTYRSPVSVARHVRSYGRRSIAV